MNFIKSNTDFISLLLHSQQQVHIFHLSTRSYSQHKALEEYYTKIGDLLDSYTETFQGAYGLLKGYKSFPIINNVNKIIPYFENLLKQIKKVVIPQQDTYLTNILDEIYQLIYQTLYKLKYLK
jgi:hypothetical protein